MPAVKLPRLSVTGPGGEPIEAAFDEWVGWLERLVNLTAEPPLRVVELPSGPVVFHDAPKRLKCRLVSAIGTTGSYNVVEAYETAAGGWADVTGGWSGVAWEYNLNPGLDAGTHVEAEWVTATGEYRFQRGSCT